MAESKHSHNDGVTKRFAGASATKASHYPRHLFHPSARHAAQRRIQNLLVLPSVFAGAGKCNATVNRIGERIHLPDVSEMVRHHLRARAGHVPTFDDYGMIDG